MFHKCRNNSRRRPPRWKSPPLPSVSQRQLRWRAPESGAATALLSISITHLEKHKMVFAIDSVPVDKDYLLDFQFPDGAEYRVTSIAQFPGRGPLRTEQLVAVTGVEPPCRRRYRHWYFFWR